MYQTCMFCGRSLGRNEVIEHFPVGRRLAFDAARGRLWVVCRRCERWNLTPIEERWEAVESCERLFRDTRVRVSTENVGLARHLEGLDSLVRIGAPLRPEFAAWRYGDQFGRRRKRQILYGVGAAAVLGGIVLGGAATGAVSGFLITQSGSFWNLWANGRTLVKLRTDDGRVLRMKRIDLLGTRLRPSEDGPFRLEVRKRRRKEWFEGEEAWRLVGAIMPGINRMGGKQRTVGRAVAEIEHHGHPERFLSDVASGDRFRDKHGTPGYVNKMPHPTKLALEMALHEEQERRALEGELWRLERAWQEAEEIAAISDDLLLPEGTEELLAKHRAGEEE